MPVDSVSALFLFKIIEGMTSFLYVFTVYKGFSYETVRWLASQALRQINFVFSNNIFKFIKAEM